MMQRLEKNIINIWGEKGREWLSRLPVTIDILARYWSLSTINPLNNMNYNYVALALQKNKIPAVLKISCDESLLLNEYKALKHFNGHGAIKVLDINTEYQALLLEQAIPGVLLKDQVALKDEEIITIYGQVVKALATPRLTDNDCKHVREWCKDFDKIKDVRIENKLAEKAKILSAILLDSAAQEYLCHGDLHLENIIQNGKNWVAIDPKGIIGEMAFEAAAFDLISKTERQNPETVTGKIIEQVTLLANLLSLNYNRLLAWTFLRVILSAQWFIEDKGDPTHMLSFAAELYPLVNQTNFNEKILSKD